MVRNWFIVVFTGLLLIPSVSNAWKIDLTFDNGIEGSQVSEFSDASGNTVYEKNVTYSGEGSAKLTIEEGSDGWGFWGGRKNFPAELGEGDDIWIKLDIFIPWSFDVTTNTGWLKFLRVRVKKEDGTHIGYHDIMIMPDGSYYHYNELSASSRIEVFREEYSLIKNYTVGETIVGAISGATATIKELKPTGFIFEYKGNKKFTQYENLVGEQSDEKGARMRYIYGNSNTFFGSDTPIVRDVWQTFVYRIKFSSKKPLIQFYKYIGETGFALDGKPIGGKLQLIYEDLTDNTLKDHTDKVDSFLLFTYWNGNAPKTQSLYIDNLTISTEPPGELNTPLPPSNLEVKLDTP